MTMPRIEGYAPDQTCRRCKFLGAVKQGKSLGCDKHEVRECEVNFPYVQGCNLFSDWYATTAKNMMAIAGEFVTHPAEEVAAFLRESMRASEE